MKIPTFNRLRFIDEQGYLTAEMQQFYDVLNTQMQDNLSDDGFVIPPRTTEQINEISDPTNQNSKPDGVMWYDSQTGQFKGKINGIVRIFQMV